MWEKYFENGDYDYFQPKIYTNSLGKAIDLLNLNSKKFRLMDAGCGNGGAISQMHLPIKDGNSYTGIDILDEGFSKCIEISKKLAIPTEYIQFIKGSLEDSKHFETFKVDKILCHYVMYTIRERDSRLRIYKNFFRALNSGGFLALGLPNKSYSIEKIVKETCLYERKNPDKYQQQSDSFYKKMLELMTPIGYKFDQGDFVRFDQQKIHSELEQCGFKVTHMEEGYGTNGYIVQAIRN